MYDVVRMHVSHIVVTDVACWIAIIILIVQIPRDTRTSQLATRINYGKLLLVVWRSFVQTNRKFLITWTVCHCTFEANGVATAKQVPVLLTAISGETYALLTSLVSQAKTHDKTFRELSAILRKHFFQPIMIAERYHFHRCQQAVGENIAEYMAELRHLASTCDLITISSKRWEIDWCVGYDKSPHTRNY